MEYHRTSHMLDTPSLEFMTETALKVLSKNEKGFFLMVCIAVKIKFIKLTDKEISSESLKTHEVL